MFKIISALLLPFSLSSFILLEFADTIAISADAKKALTAVRAIISKIFGHKLPSSIGPPYVYIIIQYTLFIKICYNNLMKTVLITGSYRGIVAATCRRLAENYKIVINYNNSKAEALLLLDEIRKVNPMSLAIKADVSKEDEVDYLFDTIEKNFGSVDILINNAGKSYVGLIQDMEFDKWQEIINTNLSSVFLTSKRAIGPMISQKYGVIINMSSIWGREGAALEACYSATKGAINSFTKALSKELSPSNIRVN